MSSIVLELQRKALDSSISVSDLLRKANVIAMKLKLVDFQAWIENELNGYKDKSAILDYRNITGQVRGLNPYNGWIPFIFDNPKEGESYSKRSCNQSIAEVEDFVGSGNSSFQMPFSLETQIHLLSKMEFVSVTNVSLIVDKSALVKIIDSVRNVILVWTLKLEEDNVMGEGMSFSDQEKSNAKHISQNINNFYGTVGSAQIQQGNKHAIQVSSTYQIDIEALSKFLESLRIKLPVIELKKEKQAEIESEITTVEAQIKSPNPKMPIIKEGLKSVRSILEGAGGSVAGQLLIELGKYFFN